MFVKFYRKTLSVFLDEISVLMDRQTSLLLFIHIMNVM